MKSLLIRNLTEDFVKESYLSTIKPNVIGIRKQFKEYVLKLNPELWKTIINHFNERLKRANNTLMLGEYAPFILGNLFSVSELTINRVAFPWFLMYEYSLLLDDLMDKKRENWQLELLSSQALLDSSFKEFITLANNRFNIFKSFDKYRDEAFDGMVNELKWSKNNSINNIKSSAIIQGRKAALVKFCVSYMIDIDQNRNISKDEECILDNICAGIQLLDDLTDFMEDHNEARLNIMLSKTYEWLENNYYISDRENINSDQLIAGLILSQSLNAILEFSHKFLNTANRLKRKNGKNTNSIEYFNELSASCLHTSKLVNNIIQYYSKDILIYTKYLFFQNNSKLFEKLKTKELIRNVFLDILIISPKSSN